MQPPGDNRSPINMKRIINPWLLGRLRGANSHNKYIKSDSNSNIPEWNK